jgi:hypothetical protein
MKQHFYSLLLFGFFLLTACSGNGNIDSTADLEKIKEMLTAEIPTDAKIFKVSLTASTEGESLNLIDAYYYDASLKDEVKHISINLNNEAMTVRDTKPLMFVTPFTVWSEHSDSAINYTHPLNDFPWNNIISMIEKAKKMIPTGYSYFGVQEYDMSPKSENPVKLIINATKDGEAKEYSNRSVTTYYYQYAFISDNSGNLTLDEEE